MTVVHLTKVERGQLKDMGGRLRELSLKVAELTADELMVKLDEMATAVSWLADAFEVREAFANKGKRWN